MLQRETGGRSGLSETAKSRPVICRKVLHVGGPLVQIIQVNKNSKTTMTRLREERAKFSIEKLLIISQGNYVPFMTMLDVTTGKAGSLCRTAHIAQLPDEKSFRPWHHPLMQP